MIHAAGPYGTRLKKYLRLRRRFWICYVLLVPLVLMSIVAENIVKAVRPDATGAMSLLSWLTVGIGFSLGLTAMWASLRMMFWPCPRCNEPFARCGFVMCLGRNCRNCGLSVWSE